MTADLSAIRARLAAATPGPWHAETSDATIDDCNLWRMRRDVQPQALLHLSAIMSSGNADLIAHAPADPDTARQHLAAARAAIRAVTPEYWCDGHATHVPTNAGRNHHA